MSTPCTTCGQPLDAHHDRCPACGALASPVVDETLAADAVDPTVAGDAPPWSIPIREPRTAAAAEGGRRNRTLGVAVAALVALAATVALADRALDGGDSGTASSELTTPDRSSTDESGGIDADVVRSATTAPATTTTTTTEATAPTTTTAAPTTTVTRTAPTTTTTAFAARTAPNGTGSVPALSTQFRGWLAQLRSVPYDAGTDGLADEWRRTRDVAPGVVAARSDDWSALGDGFWVLVDPGPFASAAEVRAFCSSAGLDGDGECLARELRG